MICLALIALLSPEAQMQKVIDLAKQEVAQGGLPFATIITNSSGEIIAEAVNTVAQSHDPTDHAEIKALRIATQKLKSSELVNHEVYAIGHPCPMCWAALTLAKPKKVYFALTLPEKNKYMPPIKYKISTEQIKNKKTEALRLFKVWSQPKK